MCLLDRILSHDPSETVCAVRSEDSRLFVDDADLVPAWVGIEYLAQCIAVHAGLLARAAGEPPRPGLFLGSRRLVFRVQGWDLGEELQVSARHFRGSGTGLQVFSCSLRPDTNAPPWIEGRLNVMLLDRMNLMNRLDDAIPGGKGET